MYGWVTLGAARPQTCGKGFHPLHPNKRNYSVGKTRQFSLAALGFTKVRRLLAQESRENPRGKVYFSLGIIPRLSPDAKHPGWRLRRRARSTTASSQTSAFLHATAGIKMIFPTKQHPLLRVQGGHRPGGDEPQTTACSGNLVCGEISRNEQSPQELRRLRLRKGQSPAVPFRDLKCIIKPS